ncbi:MAG: YciI family protein [Ilyomonas sp.]
MMTAITDEYMYSMLATTKSYCVVVLKAGRNITSENAKKIIWEHGRRNFALRSEGKVAVVAPVTREGDIAGFYIFNTNEEEAIEIMNDDPAVKEGVFEFITYPCKSFPGDGLK